MSTPISCSRRWSLPGLSSFRGLILAGLGCVAAGQASAATLNLTDPLYGAVPNDGLDDGVALRKACADLAPNDTLYIPAGVYHIDMPDLKIINLFDAGITIQGAGASQTKLIIDDTSSDNNVEFICPGADDITIRDLTFERGGNINLVFFKLTRSIKNFTLDKCVIDGRRSYGDEPVNGQPRWSRKIADGIVLSWPSNPTVLNTTVSNSTFQQLRYGLVVPTGDSPPRADGTNGKGVTDGFLVRDCLFLNNHSSDLEFNFAGAIRSENIVVRNNDFEDNLTNQDNIGWAVGYSEVVKGLIFDNDIRDYNHSGIHIEDETRNVLVAGNRLYNTGKFFGGPINLTNECDNILIKNNLLDNRGNPEPPSNLPWMFLCTGGGTGPYPSPTNISFRDNEIYMSKYNQTWVLVGSTNTSSGNFLQMQAEGNLLSASDTVSYTPDTQMQDGGGELLQANAVNDYVIFETPKLPTGTFDLTAGIKRYPNRGRYQTSFESAPVGGVNDQYTSAGSGSYDSQFIGPIVNSAFLPRKFRFDVVGRNSASTGYKLMFDYLQFQQETSNDELELFATEDTYVRGGTYAAQNFGQETEMLIKHDQNDSFKRHAYLKFDLAALQSSNIQAHLNLTPTQLGSDVSSTSFKIWAVTNDDWNEDQMVWSSRVTSGNYQITEIPGGDFTLGVTKSIDVTNFVKSQIAEDGVASFLITSTVQNDSRWMYLAASESPLPPTLVISPASN